MPIIQRVTILVVLAGAVAAVAAVGLWSQQPELQVLFSNLSPEDAGSIVQKLREMKVPYEVGAGGSSVLVPGAQVHELRLQLAGQGLPHGGGVGFEIFDRTTVGMSEFVQKLNYRRAVQGELARTIAQMPEVERARVHLAVPERRLFSAEQERARASVVLAVRRGQMLGKGQIQGVVHLVASSVEGLQPGDVTVVDGHGRLLSDAAGEPAARLSGSQLDYQRSLEKDIETRIQTMLERIVGSDKAVVRVSSLVDFRQVELTEERFDPNGQVVRSEQRNQERSNGMNETAANGGVPGVASNVPAGQAGATPAPAAPSQTSTTNNQVKSEVLNYEVSRTVSRIVEPVGTIKKLSVAVLVDGTYEAPAGGDARAGEGKRKYVPRPAEELKRIEEIVKKAMGYSAERQDQVEVVNLPFGLEQEESGGVTAEAGPPPALTLYAPYIRYGVGTVLALLILFFVVRPLVTTLTAPPPAVLAEANAAAAQGLPMTVGQAEASLGPPGAPRAQIVDMARGNPQSTALVVKNWLKPAAS
jgi:flagellar M-ring protein FliF